MREFEEIRETLTNMNRRESFTSWIADCVKNPRCHLYWMKGHVSLRERFSATKDLIHGGKDTCTHAKCGVLRGVYPELVEGLSMT